MVIMRDLGGLALAVAIPFGALGVAATNLAPLGAYLGAVTQRVVPPASRHAEVAVVFGPDGQVVSGALVRSTGSRRSDAAALDGALQLAALEPRRAVAGRTLVFGAAMD